MSSDEGTSGFPPELAPHVRKTLEAMGVNDTTLQKMIAEANSAFSIMTQNGWNVTLAIEDETSPTHRTGRPFINFEASVPADQNEPSQEVAALMTVATTLMRSAELFSDIVTEQGMDVAFSVAEEDVNGRQCPQLRAKLIQAS